MLGVTDLERSSAFYQDRVGLKLTGKYDGFAFFDGGEISLALSENLAQTLDGPPGPVEVVFAVEHVREAHAALIARGIELDIEPRSGHRAGVGGELPRPRRASSFDLRPGVSPAAVDTLEGTVAGPSPQRSASPPMVRARFARSQTAFLRIGTERLRRR